MTEFVQTKLNFPHTAVISNIEPTLYSKALKLITTLPHLQYDGTSLLKGSTYKGISLFYYTRFILFNRFALAYKEFSAFNIFKKNLNDDDTLTIYGVSPYLEKGINDQRVSVKLKAEKNDTMPLAKLALLYILRAAVGLFYLLRLSKARHLFIIPPVEKQPVLNKKTLKPQLGNPITDYFTDELFKRKDGYALEEYYPAKFINTKLSTRNIFGVFPQKAVFFEPFLAVALLKSKFNKTPLKSLRQNEMRAYQAISKNETDENIRLANLINKDLFKMRKFAMIRIEASELFFKTAKIKSIGGIDEYSVRTKSVLDIAKILGSHTYSFQHGVVHQNHAGYHYTAKDAGKTTLVSELFIYGTSTQQMLNYHNYPGHATISGQIRTDIIPILKSKASSISINGLTDDKPMVLWATQPDLPGDERSIRDSISLDFFRLTIDFPGVNFMLKLHPRENDLDYYHKLAASIGASNYIVANSDLYLLLSKCSVLLTHCSAVGAEAVYFEKPLIVQDYKDADALEYIKKGVGLRATNYTELKRQLANVLNGSTKINQQAYHQYQEQFNGKADGKVVERILTRITT